MIAGLSDGTGGKGFYNNLANVRSPKEFLERVSHVGREETVPDQWESQVLARILDRHHVIMVSDMIDPKIITAMHMEHARTFDQALQRAYELQGRDAKIAVIPDGLAVIVRQEEGDVTIQQEDFKPGEFKPGEQVPVSGIYDVLHDSLDGEPHAQPHQVTAVSGAIFPPCRGCDDGVRYQLHQAAEHVGEHHFFQSAAN